MALAQQGTAWPHRLPEDPLWFPKAPQVLRGDPTGLPPPCLGSSRVCSSFRAASLLASGPKVNTGLALIARSKQSDTQKRDSEPEDSESLTRQDAQL